MIKSKVKCLKSNVLGASTFCLNGLFFIINPLKDLLGMDLCLDLFRLEHLFYYSLFAYKVGGSQDSYCPSAASNLLAPAT